MFLYHKSPSHLHIWLAGTCPEFRRQGAMTLMFNTLLEKTVTRTVSKLTLNTYPEKFPSMFRLATRKWGMEVVNSNLADGKVCLELELKHFEDTEIH